MMIRSRGRSAAAAALLAILMMTSIVAAQDDADGDGVEDGDDDCPDTPDGEVVDANGCSEGQRNSGGGSSGSGSSSTDSDDDGVADDDDECSGTEAEHEVNAEGCAQYQVDGDRDGVMNDEDSCPDTPRSERDQVDGRGCTSFMDETFAEDVPLVGRMSNRFALSAGTVSMALGTVGWTWRASKAVGITGGSGKRRKVRFQRRIKSAKSTVELDRIKKEIRKANDKNRLPDGAFADLIAAGDQRRIDILNKGSDGEAKKELKLRPSSRPPGI